MKKNSSSFSVFIGCMFIFILQGRADTVFSMSANTNDFLEPCEGMAGAPADVSLASSTASISLDFYESTNFANGGPASDGFLVNFITGENNGLDSLDAPKIFNPSENVALLNNGAYLIFETRDMPTQSDVLQFFNNNYQHQNYLYEINVNGLSHLAVFLDDAWLGTQTRLWEGVNQVAFGVDNNIPGSIANNRFSISFVVPEFTYENNAWAPSSPNGVSLDTEDVFIVNGTTGFTADTQLGNLILYPGATLNIEQVLSVNESIDNYGSLVFINDVARLGQLDDMTGAIISGSGEATVQRYIPARRAYRALSSAVTTTTNINANWQEGVHNTGTNYPADNLDPNPGFGTHITGSATGANGFDATQIGFHSLYGFDAANQAWVAVTNTDVNTLGAGEALLLYVRGDRGINLGSTANPPPTTSTILRATGNLQVGNYTDNTLSATAGGFSFVGNPFQAIVNMNDVLANSTNLNTSYYYVWDPNLGSYGAYALVSLPGGTATPGGSGANEFLQPGQGAFVSTLATSPATFLVEEADKDVAQTPTNVFKPQATASIALELYEAGAFAKGGAPADGFLVNFNPSGNNAVGPKDAPKPMNFNENVGLVNGTSILIMENRDLPTQSDVLPLYNDNYRHTDYVYQIRVDGLAGASPVLVDAYLGAQTPLQDGLNSIAFSVDESIAASVAPDRFSIVFQNKLSTGEVSITGFGLYPNPVKGDSFFVLAPGTAGQDLRVSIYDLLGRKVYGEVREVGSDSRIEVSATQLQTGVYMVELNHSGKSLIRKLIVE